MYYFELNEENLDFAAELNEGVRPEVCDELGWNQYFVVTPGQPNNIISMSDPEGCTHLSENGIKIIFETR